MSQYVVLSVSSDVITFHRRGRKRKAEKRKNQGKKREKYAKGKPKTKKAERENGKGWKSRKRHEADKEKLYYAEWRASCL